MLTVDGSVKHSISTLTLNCYTYFLKATTTKSEKSTHEDNNHLESYFVKKRLTKVIQKNNIQLYFKILNSVYRFFATSEKNRFCIHDTTYIASQTSLP
jgi:hypothetical protein